MNYLKELLFPRRCPVCDEIVSGFGEFICPGCYERLEPVDGAVCCQCGKKLSDGEGEYCRDCRREKHLFDRNFPLYSYRDIADGIYRFKYGNRQEYAGFFGREMAARYRGIREKIRPDGLIPVPLHRERMRKRGYNQAELLAEVIGREWNIPVYRKMVIRQKKTLPQKDLNAAERQNNLKKAFNLAGNGVKLNTIIIVDDIYTTGSTLDAISELFRESGTRKIYGMTLAIGKER